MSLFSMPSFTITGTSYALHRRQHSWHWGKRRDCNDMLPVLEWVFVPVNQPSFRAGGVNGGAKLAVMQQLQITVL